MTKQEAMTQMQLEVEQHLGKIERVFGRWKLPLTKITLIARDPSTDNMMVVLTTEDEEGLQAACDLALAQQTTT